MRPRFERYFRPNDGRKQTSEKILKYTKIKYLPMKAILFAALLISAVTTFSLNENIVFLSSCLQKINFTDLDVILNRSMIFFSSNNDVTWPFHSKKWFLRVPLSFDTYSMKSICVSLYFFTSFLKIDFFWFLIFWVFRYELTCFKPLGMIWKSFSFLPISRSSIIIWSYWLLTKRSLHLLQQHLIQLGSWRNS